MGGVNVNDVDVSLNSFLVSFLPLAMDGWRNYTLEEDGRTHTRIPEDSGGAY